MKLIDLLSLTTDHTFMDVVSNETSIVVATYNGKDSIPNYLNDACVRKIDSRSGKPGIAIYVSTEMALTEYGVKVATDYIKELEAKKKEIIDAGKDETEMTVLPDLEDIIEDVGFIGLDDQGEYYNGWAVTDNYDSDYPLLLKYGRDLKYACSE